MVFFLDLPEATSSKWKIGQATYFSERTRPFWQKWGHFDKIQAIFDKIQAIFDKIVQNLPKIVILMKFLTNYE